MGEVLWAARTSEELVGTVEQIETLRAQLAGLEASVLAEIDARQIPKKELAWGSTADWFTHLAGTTRGKGHRTVQQAPILVGERTATHAAMLAGRVSPEQAAVIVAAVEKLPLDAGVRAHAEAVLLGEAARLDATDLGAAAKRLVELADPEKAERDAEKALDREDRAAHHGRYLSISEDGAGGVRLRGRGTVEDAALLKAALLPLTKPQPAVDVERPGLRGRAGSAGPRRPDVGRPGDHGRARAGHRPAPGLPRRPAPGHRHHQPGRAPSADRLGHPRHQCVDHRRRPGARALGGPAAGLRRRHHPRRPRQPAARSSTSAACTGWSPRRSGGPSSAATSTAPSPAAPGPR